jgi:hypothetical protein
MACATCTRSCHWLYSVRNAPGLFCQGSARSTFEGGYPTPGGFWQRVRNHLKIKELSFLEAQKSAQEYEKRRDSEWRMVGAKKRDAPPLPPCFLKRVRYLLILKGLLFTLCRKSARHECQKKREQAPAPQSAVIYEVQYNTN